MQGVGPTHDFLKHSKTGKLRCACLVRAVKLQTIFYYGYFYGNDRLRWCPLVSWARPFLKRAAACAWNEKVWPRED